MLKNMKPNEKKKCPLFLSLIGEKLAIKIEAIVLWRCPTAFFCTLIISEFVFFCIYQMNLEFISTVTFVLLAYSILRFIWSIFGNHLEPFLFGQFPMEEEKQSNRIRSFNELIDLAIQVQEKADNILLKLYDYLLHPSLKKTFLFFGVLGILYIIFTIIGSYSFCFVVFHLFLIGPGFYFHPSFQRYLEQRKAKTKLE